MAYPDPYQRPAPDHFVRRWLFITACIAALMLLWQFLPAIEAWFSPREAADRTVTARGDLAADEKATIELFEKSRASVVYITTAQLVRDVWTRNVFSVPRGTGSGFIWDDAGHVVTNFHVIQGASEATVKLADGRDYQAALVGTSPAHDIAVLKIGVGFKRPPAVPVGTSADLKVGQKVFAIYSPSGASAGIGFAVPVDTVMRVVPQLIKTGKYIRPALGIEVDEQLNQRLLALTGTKGVFVLRVTPGSAAHKAGLAGVEVTPQGIVPGDRITGVDGQATDDVAKLLARLDDRKVGDVVVLSVERAGKSREVRVELQPGN